MRYRWAREEEEAEAVACHWGLPDPAAAAGGQAARRAAFEETFGVFERRVRRLVGPGFDGLSAGGIAARLTAADDHPVKP